jgi:L-arabinose isomerase
MIDLNKFELWFLTGSQNLYGQETLNQVDDHVTQIVNHLNDHKVGIVKIVKKDVVTTPETITKVCHEANANENCIGIITWMHTFSPAKMWIRGLNNVRKPICHLHTQYNDAIPWDEIDMDFMNLNQSAHGDREFGYIMTRMKKRRKVVVGHWKDKIVWAKINKWSRVCLGWHEMQSLKVARIGDNMREVAVTEGDKVGAQIKFGMAVNGFDTSDVLKYINAVNEADLAALIEEYEESYHLAKSMQKGGDQRNSLKDAAKIELGLRRFLEEGNFGAFTDTFENLDGFTQLPGIASQRLMQAGYGFGAEGDWKTAAMLRCAKTMSIGMEGGTSFMEDYTYHFARPKSLVLGAHMLEICPSIARDKPSCEIHPLAIGGKADPVRLVFNAMSGPAVNISLIDIGSRFRLIVNEVESIVAENDLPKLPVARVLWDAKPNLDIAATAWILAGGAHHTVYSQSIDTEFMEDFAEIAGIELLVIDNDTKIRNFKNLINSNELYYSLGQKNH